MALEPHRDDWDLRHLSSRRRPGSDRFRRHLRSYRPPRHDADGTRRLARRHTAVRGGAGRPVALRRPRPDGRRRRPYRGTFDRSRRGIRHGWPDGRLLATGRTDRDGGAGRRLRRCLAARRCADRLRAVADPALLLGPGFVADAPLRRDVVPAASHDDWHGRDLAPAPAVRVQRGAQGLRDRIGRDDDGLHARRADPLARRPGRPRPHRVRSSPAPSALSRDPSPPAQR